MRQREFICIKDPAPELNVETCASFLVNVQKAILLSLEKRGLLTHSQQERCLTRLEAQYNRKQQGRDELLSIFPCPERRG